MQNLIMKLLEISAFSSIMILVVLGLKKVFGAKINSKVISAMWLLVMLRMIIPITIDSPFHLKYSVKQETPVAVNATNSQVENVTHSTISREVQNVPVTNNQIDNANETVVAYDAPVEIPKQSFYAKAKDMMRGLNYWHVGFGIWILGCVYLLVLKLSRIIRMRANIQKFSEHSERLSTKLFKMAKLIGLKQDVRIAESIFIDTPIVFGVLKPIIILPKGLSKKIESQKLNMIILHELCHIKRLDIMKNFLWLIFKCVYWFNPLVYFGYKSYLDDIEDACDMKVVSYLNRELKCEYAQSLLDVVRIAKHDDKFPIAVFFCEDRNTLERRITNMIRPKKKLVSAGVISGVLCVAMIFGCFTTACISKQSEKVANIDSKGISKQTIDSKNDKAVNQEIVEKKEYKKLSYPIYDIADYIENKDEGIIAEVNITKDNIFIPEYVMPTVLVEKAEIPFETYNKLVKMLAGDMILYDGRLHQQVMTKKKLEQQKEMYQAELDASINDGVKQGIQTYSKKIERIEEEMKTSPDSYDSLPDNYFEKQFERIIEYEKEDEPEFDEEDFRSANLEYNQHIPNTEPITLTEENFESIMYGLVVGEEYFADSFDIVTPWGNNGTYAFRYFKNTNKISTSIIWESLGVDYSIMQDFELSESKALDMAREYVNVIDEGLILTNKEAVSYFDFVIDEDKHYPFGYMFTFEKTYEGVGTKFIDPVNTDYLLYQKYEISSTPPEKLIIGVHKDGVFFIEYSSPAQQKELLKEETPLLSFDEVKEILLHNISNEIIPRQKYANTVYNYYNKAYLCLREIYDVRTSEIIVKPVWIFTGDGLPIDKEVKESKIEEFHENGVQLERVYLAINAETGSVIDLDMGVDLADMDSFEVLEF